MGALGDSLERRSVIGGKRALGGRWPQAWSGKLGPFWSLVGILLVEPRAWDCRCLKKGSYKEVPPKKMQALYWIDLISTMPDCRLMIFRKRTCHEKGSRFTNRGVKWCGKQMSFLKKTKAQVLIISYHARVFVCLSQSLISKRKLFGA